MKNKNHFIAILFFINIFFQIFRFSSFGVGGGGFGGEVVAQNTFRYKICSTKGVTGYSPWRMSSYQPGLFQTPVDSGYVLLGKLNTKLDKYGNLEWAKTYKDKAETIIEINDAIVAADGAFVMAGIKERQTPDQGDPFDQDHDFTSYVQKMDKNGLVLWAKKYNISGDGNNRAIKILEMPDEGFIVMGSTRDDAHSQGSNNIINPHMSYNTYLLRLDKDGNKTWCNYYDAGTNGEEEPTSLSLAADGGFMISGNAFADPRFGFTLHPLMKYVMAFMMKISANGQTVGWAKWYGGYDTMDFTSAHFYDLKATPDGGYIVVGTINYIAASIHPNNIASLAVKINASGVVEWQKMYNNISTKQVEVIPSGYLLGGDVLQERKISGIPF